ncbi:hypothetical protein QTJ16_000217 [Diplocarpon rosae]|uniref:Uncharacterized protein n=1 Tax=Diplocarpon rosae TaxID=946125 RepID=A0AAD9T5I7_9HELO|nr:hypothetical protein QTJ16_000217 [Diplocarpon rosae]
MEGNSLADVWHHWNDEHHVFQVYCGRGDVLIVWQTFNAVINGVIREAIATVHTNSDKAQNDEYGLDPDGEIKSSKAVTVTKQDEERPADTLTNEYPEELKYYKFRHTWPCREPIDELLPDQDLAELSRLTSCKFEKNINDNLLYVGGFEDELVQVAIKKLDVIIKHWDLRGEYNSHVLYTEEVEDVKFVFKLFVDIRKKYFETTLLDNNHVAFIGHSNYETLINAVTIRCALYNPVKSSYISSKNVVISPLPISSSAQDVGAFTTAFHYCGKGDSSNDPMRHRQAASDVASSCPGPLEATELSPAPTSPQLSRLQDYNSSAKSEAVQNWAKQIPEVLPAPSFSAADALAYNNLQSRPHGIFAPPGSRGAQKTPNERPAWDNYTEYSPEKASKGAYIEKSTRQNTVARSSNTNLGSTSKTGAHQYTSPALAVARPIARPMAPKQRELLAAAPRTSLATNSGATISNFLEDMFPTKHVPSQNVQSPQAALQKQVPSANRSELLIPDLHLLDSANLEMDLLDDVISIVNFPTLQPTPQIRGFSHRAPGNIEEAMGEQPLLKFHQTMNQKAPKPKAYTFAGRLDGPNTVPEPFKSTAKPELSQVETLPEFEKLVNSSFEELMRGLQGYRGQVTVQLEFGRIILGHVHLKHISSKDREHIHSADQARNLLLHPTKFGPRSNFTDVLTRVPSDVQYLINMKNNKGQDLWESKVSRWAVTYEFLFFDSFCPDIPFMIEVNAETFAVQIKTRRPLANIWIHGTKRHWDAKIAAIGHGSSEVLEEKYGELAAALETSLYIPSGLQHPELSWQLDKSFTDRFACQDLSVHRACQYRSVDQKSSLKITEIQALDIYGGYVPGEPFSIYEAKPGPADRLPIVKLNSWFRASISCAELNSLLEQNNSLELGDEAGWTLGDVAEVNAAKSMYMPAVSMLKKMDAIGQASNNGSDFRSRDRGVHGDQASQEKPDVVWW